MAKVALCDSPGESVKGTLSAALIVSPGLLTASVAAAFVLGAATNAAISLALAQPGSATASASRAVRAMVPQVGLPGTSRSPEFNGCSAAISVLPKFQGNPGAKARTMLPLPHGP